ncbi:MAG: redoxin domain-containing protein, partial [FCB group bacterium]
ILFFFLLQVSSDAQNANDILHEMHKTTQNLKSVTFTVEYKVKVSTEDKPHNANVKFLLKRDNNIKAINSKVKLEYDNGKIIGFDGRFYKYINTKEKKLTIIDSCYNSVGRIKGNWVGNPISIMLPNDTIEFRFDEKLMYELDQKFYIIDDIDCYKISLLFQNTSKVDHNDDEQFETESRTEYYIGKKDFLPRKYCKYSIYSDSTTFSTEYIFQDVKINPKLSDSIFNLTAPDGYTVENYKPEPLPEILKPGTQAPDFTLKNENGEDVNLKMLNGKIIILDFWGTWCHWCWKAMPMIQKAYEKYKDKGIIFYGISCNEKPKAEPAKFMKQNNYTYGLLLNGNDVAKSYNVFGFPTLYIINKEGTIIQSTAGYRKDLDTYISDILDKELEK